MNLEVTVQSYHPSWKTMLRPYGRVVRSTCEAALTAASIKEAEMTVVLAGDMFIRDLNKTYRGQSKATNVLAFPEQDNVHVGDLILAFETIEREAQEQGKSFKDHAQHMLVHGTLHLLGYDHEHKSEAARMESMEIKILEKLGVNNPYL